MTIDTTTLDTLAFRQGYLDLSKFMAIFGNSNGHRLWLRYKAHGYCLLSIWGFTLTEAEKDTLAAWLNTPLPKAKGA